MSWECSACAGRQLILLLFYFNLYFCGFGSLPFAFCLRLCHLLPAATAAAAWHSDCWNWTKNFACATAAFSLLRAGVATLTSTLTVTTTPTPTTTTATTHEKLAALAALVLVFLQWIVRSRGFHVCVCAAVAAAASVAVIVCVVGCKTQIFFPAVCFIFFAVPLRWPWLLRNKGYIGFV